MSTHGPTERTGEEGEPPIVEAGSFTFDHTATPAPYVRLICVETGLRGDEISNFGLRFVQPNENIIPTGDLYTIEHLLASLLCDRMEDVIGCSPLGCRTGFHLVTWETLSVETVIRVLVSLFETIATNVS